MGVPAGAGRGPCMSTDLGSLTKALGNLFCHIPFTPRNGFRTAYQSSCVTARCSSRLVSIERFSPLNVPLFQLLQDWISVGRYGGVRNLPYAAMWPNEIEWIVRCILRDSGTMFFFHRVSHCWTGDTVRTPVGLWQHCSLISWFINSTSGWGLWIRNTLQAHSVIFTVMFIKK